MSLCSITSRAPPTSDDCFQWANSAQSPRLWRRQLTNFECMFTISNRHLHGQNCPFMGLTISVQQGDVDDSDVAHVQLSAEDVWDRAVRAVVQTRWKYPTLAAKIDGKTATYSADTSDEMQAWARRIVKMQPQEGGWVALRDRLSRETCIPSEAGDYCLFYLVIRTVDEISGRVTSFDLLMHCHHTLFDGAGIRSVINELLARMAAPLADETIRWGAEVEHLLPAAISLCKEEELGDTNGATVMQLRKDGNIKPGLGLPVYRPDITKPLAENRGSLFVAHTWPADFLPRLLAASRRHKVKLAAVLHASLLQVVAETLPTPFESADAAQDVFKSGSAIDLRNVCMLQPWASPHRYVNCAVAIQPIEVPARLFRRVVDGDDQSAVLGGIWDAAAFIQERWEDIKTIKAPAKKMESDATGLVKMWDADEATARARLAVLKTCPYYVSDPPGELLLSSSYPLSDATGVAIVIDSYQLSSDQSNATVSARSHSWDGRLTLCLVFNAVRNPREKMREVLDKWVEVTQLICEDGGAVV